MIRSLQHVGMTIPDLEVGRSFYEAVGLEARISGQHVVMRCKGRAQDQVRLMPGIQKHLSYISFGTDAEGLQAIRENLSFHGVVIHPAPFDIGQDGIWFRDPSGDWVHVNEADSMPAQPLETPELNTPGRYRRIGERGCTPTSKLRRVTPLRLGHLIKFTADVNRSIEFYTRVLGMKVSDRAGDKIAFLRCGCGGDHHVLGLAKSSHSGLHHLSFEVTDLDEIQLGAKHLMSLGYESAFGLGRHVAGSNYFHYIRDPWSSMVEYFWDIDVIPEDDSEWEAFDGDPQDVIAVWATNPPPEAFIKNFEAARDE